MCVCEALMFIFLLWANIMDYVPLCTYDFKLAVCQACSSLPSEVVRELIYPNLLKDATPVCPDAPIKRKSSVSGIINRLRTNGRLSRVLY